MESGLRVLLLTAVMAATAGCSLFGRDDPPMEDASASEPVISPEVERREVRTPDIDTEDFEITGFIGMISVEDFGTNTIYGARAAYHVSEGLFIEGTYATISGDLGLTSWEILGNAPPLLDNRDYSYYNLSLGWNLLPGEVFIGRTRAFNSALYVIGGAGNTDFAGEDLFTISVGAGYRVLATDSIALHFDVRDHIFDNDVTGEDKTTHNIEFSLGLSWFF